MAGFNHIDLGTRNMEGTRRFYEDVMRFPLARADLVEVEGEGRYRHFFFDVGNGQLLGFFSAEDIEGSPEFDTGINRGLGVRDGTYHFAFEAESLDVLEAVKARLEGHGVEVRGPFDHEGWSKSIYFKDPNGLNLEYCHLTRAFTPEDARPVVRFRVDTKGRKTVLDPLVLDTTRADRKTDPSATREIDPA
jgi:catechol 2,3-dioxygenase-like lactoylglutathione lyase family enzyme